MGELRLLVVAGEASGDSHAAAVVRALRAKAPGLDARGMGGPQLAAAGVHLDVDLRRVTTMGGVEVLARAPALGGAFLRLSRLAATFRPHVALLVDMPDFNIPLSIRFDRRRTKVVAFVAPQLWAWRPGRASALRRRFDAVACIFPFEEEPLRRQGVRASFVGHPLCDEPLPSRAEAREALALAAGTECLALLPGSRPGEVARLLPTMLEGARRLRRSIGCEVLLAAAPSLAVPPVPSWVRVVSPEHPSAAAGTPHPGRVVLAAADAALVASGSATLEAAFAGVPQVVLYRMAAPTYWLARAIVRGRFFAMPNVLLRRRAVPELLQAQVSADAIEHHLRAICRDEETRAAQTLAAREVRSQLGGSGAASRTAGLMLRTLAP